MSIKVTCEVPEQSGKTNIRVHSHWNYNDEIQLEVFESGGEPHRYTVVAKDLIEAVNNCMNTNKWR